MTVSALFLLLPGLILAFAGAAVAAADRLTAAAENAPASHAGTEGRVHFAL